jgi:methylated-DNA-[protein]-cysteine S-methyltransferase
MNEALHVEAVASPLGDIVLASRDGKVVALGYRDGWENLAARMPGASGVAITKGGSSPAAKALEAYLAGDLDALDTVEVDLAGTPFQRSVWKALRRIPAGTTLTYAELARKVGRPKAVRAVGNANGANPVSIIVPCHRVVATGGGLGGYAYGLDRKRWLLTHEARGSSRVIRQLPTAG